MLREVAHGDRGADRHFAAVRGQHAGEVQGGSLTVPDFFDCKAVVVQPTDADALGRAIAWSGGSEPGTEVNPAAIEAMREVGIDITGEYPKPWTEEIVRKIEEREGHGLACISVSSEP